MYNGGGHNREGATIGDNTVYWIGVPLVIKKVFVMCNVIGYMHTCCLKVSSSIIKLTASITGNVIQVMLSEERLR